jgi:glycoside hydrolase-like protein
MMTLAGTVATAVPGTQGFDSDTMIASATASALFAAGFRFAVRYLSRTEPQNPSDLGGDEAQAILNAGLALMAVQHSPLPGWAPTAALGEQYGQTAARNAASIGLLEGSACGSIWKALPAGRPLPRRSPIVTPGPAPSRPPAFCPAFMSEQTSRSPETSFTGVCRSRIIGNRPRPCPTFRIAATRWCKPWRHPP